MTDKVAIAIETLRIELGLATISVWAPDGDDAEVQAIFFGKDEEALTAAALAFVQGDKPAS